MNSGGLICGSLLAGNFPDPDLKILWPLRCFTVASALNVTFTDLTNGYELLKLN